ncbi:methionyl-tRNA formyltransferase [Rhodopila sp.]|jgi:methionyl-tRNA formyltransferase|uniref:methionyl-tRNA formyltransferase n=1 Tax=Rhodopila sp. TaxID=2480087 RepID=UPI002C44BBD1|nr:methionyl-tRNA formyltransferase [Rhodopila sp.]HVZ09063.1 methionyl-tRNA formyltransferase [Rhodopila sp.]
MRLAFMGSPDFAVPALRALHTAGHIIAAVYCQPARPAGRGQAVRRCAVHVAAERLGLPVRTPERLRGNATALAEFAALDLDVAVVAAYGQILPQAMLDAPRRGCLNIHASLLPRWRGAAPIHAAIRGGDTETGITIMQMDAGLDTGAMRLKRAVPITPTTTTATLHDELARLGATMIVEVLATWPDAVPQPDTGVTYAAKLGREDGRIDWSQPADAVDRQVRAFDPWPGTFTTLRGDPLKVLAVAKTTGHGEPGTTLDDRLTVACGNGALRLLRVQAPGRSAMDADAFLRGHAVPAGTRLGTRLGG